MPLLMGHSFRKNIVGPFIKNVNFEYPDYEILEIDKN